MAPSIWETVSSVLFDIMRNSNCGCSITSPISDELSDLIGFTFIDDTDLVALEDGTQDVPVQRIKQILDLCQEDLLHDSGGILNPENVTGMT